ncbi:alanine racemase [Halovulum sp. GXIMD14793]
MRAVLTIDLDAIAANWAALDTISAGDVETAAVFKANAYGLGLEKVAEALWSAGARSFFVAIAEEGAALRKILTDARIFVFSGLMAWDTALCRDAKLIPLLNSPEQCLRHRSECPETPFGLQLDTGMNRLGIEPQDFPQLCAQMTAQPELIISHLACADMPGHPQNAAQHANFAAMTSDFADVPLSLAATGGILLGPDYHQNLTRPGIGLYGGLPFKDARPVVTLDLPVIQSRRVAVGETVGYGADWVARTPARIATVAAGYADGILRALGNGTVLYADDTPCPVVGRISMDLITVDITHLPGTPDALTLLGPHQAIDDLATKAGTIGYEILTSLGARYERVYKGG